MVQTEPSKPVPAEPVPAEPVPAATPLAFEDFLKVDIRAGTITRAQPYDEARVPAYKIWVDFGAEFGERKTSAQVTENYRSLV